MGPGAWGDVSERLLEVDGEHQREDFQSSGDGDLGMAEEMGWEIDMLVAVWF